MFLANIVQVLVHLGIDMIYHNHPVLKVSIERGEKKKKKGKKKKKK